MKHPAVIFIAPVFFGYRHYGVLMPNGMVWDNFPGRGISRQSLEEFTKGKDYYHESDSLLSTEEVLNNIKSTMVLFDAISYNCEHFALDVTGQPVKSDQVLAAACIFFVTSLM